MSTQSVSKPSLSAFVAKERKAEIEAALAANASRDHRRVNLQKSDALSYHRLANLLPAPTKEEVDSLAANMKLCGYRDGFPIILYEGKILDGRTRYLATKKAGIAAVFAEFTGDDPVSYVIGTNVTRRHLKESQRALMGGRLATQEVGANQYDKKGVPIGTAAKLLNISRQSVNRAKKLFRLANPEVIKEVEQGKLTISAALKTVSAHQDAKPKKSKKADDRWESEVADPAFVTLADLWAESGLAEAWKKTPKKIRQRFIADILTGAKA